jgi:general secretion pathway protein B
MSSILKALRKLEEEKRGGKLEAPDLRVDQGQSVAVGKSLLPLIVGVVLGAVVVGLIFFWPTGTRQKPDVMQSVTPTVLSPVVEPPAASPQIVTDPPPASQTAKPLLVATAPAKPAASVAPVVSEPVVSRPVRMSPAPADIAKPAAPVEVVVQQELPTETMALPYGMSLNVTEIFYQDVVNSMAVVNDLPVMVGSHVDSAVVTEIRADRVLFEIDGKVYPVSVLQP